MDKRILIIEGDLVVNVVITPSLEAVALAAGQTAEVDTVGVDVGFVRGPGGVFGPPPPPAMSRDELFAHAALARFIKETGGIDVDGSPIATDRESQALISGAFALVQAQPETTIRFKTPAGFVTLDGAQMSAIAVAVAQYVQACFATEADVSGDIEAGEITTAAQIDAAFE